MAAFDHIKDIIDSIYKDLTKSSVAIQPSTCTLDPQTQLRLDRNHDFERGGGGGGGDEQPTSMSFQSSFVYMGQWKRLPGSQSRLSLEGTAELEELGPQRNASLSKCSGVGGGGGGYRVVFPFDCLSGRTLWA